jgi:serine phosphatase RsbU (regulator of sigma subunit)/pSer/pThr/pTyr-binding forkhead associated (FHA) protein
MAMLIVLQGGKAVSHQIGEGETVLGRHPACTIQLDSNTVSRRHAQITKVNGQYFIEDLGSGNGTFVNGKQISAKTQLHHDDRIKLGPILLRFQSEGSALITKPEKPALSRPQALAETSHDVDFVDEAEDATTITGTLVGIGGGGGGQFGMLEVQPEAKLKAVIEITRSLAGIVDVKAICPKILDTLFDIFPQADRGCILLKDENGKLVPRAMKHRRADEDATVKLSRTILNKVLNEKTGILSADAANDAAFSASESISSLSIRSMMCVPLLSHEGEPMGAINLDTQNPISQFSEEDLDLLMAVAGQAALSYESARLLVTFMEKKKQDGEMEIARNVQRALLPSELPKADGYEFYASYDSAQAVGGDYYDAMKLDDNLVCLSFGDVAGKGVPGALIMSRMASCVQNTMQFVHEVGPAVEAINHHMCANAVEGRFVTYVLAIINTTTHEMSLVNAGHMSPIIRRADGSLFEFGDETVGVPIGVVDGYPFDVLSYKLEPGDLVVLFTDGVSEAMNSSGQLYTLEHLREFIQKGPTKADELGRALLADVRRHANGFPQNDDITIMTFGRNPL